MGEGGTSELVRRWLREQPEAAMRLLAARHRLTLGQLGRGRFDPVALSGNGLLPWRELLAPPPPWVDFRLLSATTGDFWTLELLERHARLWDFAALSANPSLPWSADLVDRFLERWSFKALSANPGLPWSEDLLAGQRQRWVWSRIAANPGVPWNGRLVQRFGAELSAADPDFVPFELPRAIAPGVTLCESGWHHLQQNRAVVWSEVLDLLPCPAWSLLSRNPALPWSSEFIALHERDLDWGSLAVNPSVPWDLSIIDRHADELGWFQLAGNPALPWSDELLARFEPHAESVWRRLSANTGASWTLEQLERHAHLLEWGSRGISGHAALDEPLIAAFQSRLDFEQGLSQSSRVGWTTEILERWASRFSWERLGANPALPWTSGLLVRFADRWRLESFEHNDVAWLSLCPYLDDEAVDQAIDPSPTRA